MINWGWFRKKGCLDGKSEQQKIDFFNKLYNFASSDPAFFKQQVLDLKFHEQLEFQDYIYNKGQQQKSILVMLSMIKAILKEKHK